MVSADFWNGDPDIDAICRMEYRPDCKFDEKYFPFSSNTFIFLIHKIHFYTNL